WGLVAVGEGVVVVGRYRVVAFPQRCRSRRAYPYRLEDFLSDNNPSRRDCRREMPLQLPTESRPRLQRPLRASLAFVRAVLALKPVQRTAAPQLWLVRCGDRLR